MIRPTKAKTKVVLVADVEVARFDLGSNYYTRHAVSSE